MIPDPIQDFDYEQARRHASLLIIIAAADGELVREEISVIEAAMGASMLHPDIRNEVRRMLSSPPLLSDVIGKMSMSELRLGLRDAVLVAAADGQCDATELKILNHIATSCGLKEDSVRCLIEWVEDGWNWMDVGLDLVGLPQRD